MVEAAEPPVATLRGDRALDDVHQWEEKHAVSSRSRDYLSGGFVDPVGPLPAAASVMPEHGQVNEILA